MIKLPLRRVTVEGKVRRAGRNSQHGKLERRFAAKTGAGSRRAEFPRDVAIENVELALRRFAFLPRHFFEANFLHGSVWVDAQEFSSSASGELDCGEQIQN